MSKNVELKAFQLESSGVWLLSLSDNPNLFALMPAEAYTEIHDAILHHVKGDEDAYCNEMVDCLVQGFCMSSACNELVVIEWLESVATLRWQVEFSRESLVRLQAKSITALTQAGIAPTQTHH